MQTQKTAETVVTGGRAKGFFGSLFDLSFRHFVTERVVSFLYVSSLLFASVGALFCTGYLSVLLGVFLATVYSGGLGWISGLLLFLTPVVLFVSVVYVRVLLEIVVVLFRISENTAELAAGKGR